MSETPAADWRNNLARLTEPIQQWPAWRRIDLMRQSRQPVMDEFVRSGDAASGHARDLSDADPPPELSNYQI